MDLSPEELSETGAVRTVRLIQMLNHICALVVDDDSAIRNLVNLVLQSIDVGQVLMAPDGQSALDLVNNRGAEVNLVICDMMMPGMDGLTFLEKFRVLKPQVPFVMLSAKSDSVNFNKAKSAGADYYFMKPLDPSDLAARIESIIQTRAGA